MANQLDDFLAANTKERKPFSMTDYEAIPIENRQEYVKTTSIPARNQVSKPLDIEGEIKAKAPIAPQRAKEIKAIFKPQPEMPQEQQVPAAAPMQQAAPAAPQLPSNEIDMGQIRDQAASMQAPTSWEDWLPSLAPLITEALMGGGGKSAGESLGISGKYLTDTVGNKVKRQQSLEDKLLERDKLRYAASLKSKSGAEGKLYEVDADGNPMYVTRDQAIGQQAYKDLKKGSDRGEIAEMNRKQQKELADRKFGMDLRKELIKEPTFSKLRGRYAATNDAIGILNQKNPVGDAGVQMIFAKGIFGEVGNLTAQEQAKFAGSPAFARSWDRMVEKMNNGTLSWEDRKDLLALAEAMRDSSKSAMKDVASKYIKGTKALGFDSEDFINPLLETSDIPSIYKDLGQPKPKTVIQNGVTYTLNEKGEYK